jgi:hypothetical protein
MKRTRLVLLGMNKSTFGRLLAKSYIGPHFSNGAYGVGCPNGSCEYGGNMRPMWLL